MELSSELIPIGLSPARLGVGDQSRGNRRNATDQRHITLRVSKRIFRGKGDRFVKHERMLILPREQISFAYLKQDRMLQRFAARPSVHGVAFQMARIIS